MSTLRARILHADEPLDAIASALDALSHPDRCDVLRSLGRDGQRALYRKADAAAMTLEDLVPASLGALVPVHHQGRNTLPLPPPHREFQKRFARAEGDPKRLFGYNAAPSERFIGPGYFVAYETHEHPHWRSLGGVVVDYFQVPDGAVPPGWPKVVPNTHGLQRFVYHRTRDFLRRVSSTVSIGAAYKEDRALDHYFTLAREAR